MAAKTGTPGKAGPRVHVLYLEQANDQRGEDGQRSPGVFLDCAGRGPCLCAGCGGVADVWRGRLDNMQTTLRMCCSEGAIFRPFVAQFAFCSPRASILYDVPQLGSWMRTQGVKRPTEALIVGSALRAHRGELSPVESGIAVSSHALAAGGADDEMWAWVGGFVARVRERAKEEGGLAVALTLDKKAPLLSPTPMAGVLAQASGAQPAVADIVVVVGGPSGFTAGWAAKLNEVLGEPKERLAVSLRGGLQHSYAAVLDLLLMHEREELLPLLLDRLAVPVDVLKRARAAEHELRRAWVASLGLDLPAQPGARDVAATALGRHPACVAALASVSPQTTPSVAAVPAAGPPPATGPPKAKRRKLPPAASKSGSGSR